MGKEGKILNFLLLRLIKAVSVPLRLGGLRLKFATEAQRTRRYFYIGFLHENVALNFEIVYYFSLCVSAPPWLNY
jgi:hypothetical protein